MEYDSQEYDALKCFEHNSACEKMPHIAAYQEYLKTIDNVTDYAYVRGLDVTFGTYFTDYIVGITCFFYGLSLCFAANTVKVINDDSLRSDKNETTNKEKRKIISKTLDTHMKDLHKLMQSIAASFFLCAIMHVVGGLVHHQVKYITPNVPLCVYDSEENETDTRSTSLITCIDEFEALRPQLKGWYFTWQLANILGSSFAVTILIVFFRTIICDNLYFPQILLPASNESRLKTLISVLQDEKCAGRRSSNLMREYSKFIIGGLLTLLLTQVLFQSWKAIAYMTFNEDSIVTTKGLVTEMEIDALKTSAKEKFVNLWSVIMPSVILAIAFLAYAILLTHLLVVNLRQSNRRRTETVNNPTRILTPNTSGEALLHNTSANSDLPNTQNSLRNMLSTLPVPSIRCISLWTIFFSGAMEAALASVCGMNNATSCPLPEQFNHNALYHVILTFGMTFWCVAEHAHCRQEIKAMKKLRQTLQED